MKIRTLALNVAISVALVSASAVSIAQSTPITTTPNNTVAAGAVAATVLLGGGR